MSVVPAIRIRDCNAAPIRADGDFVLYWMIAFRRLGWNFSLQRAVEWAKQHLLIRLRSLRPRGRRAHATPAPRVST
jgi:deoxyribodipyrimidine photo-lyase